MSIGGGDTQTLTTLIEFVWTFCIQKHYSRDLTMSRAVATLNFNESPSETFTN